MRSEARTYPEFDSGFGVLGFAGRVVETKFVGDQQEQVGGGERGTIKAWTAASRRRFLFRMAALDFNRLLKLWGGRFVFMTLTYRDDPGPERFHRDRDVFLKRLHRQVGARRWSWKVEFQARGVPHLHVLAWVPFTDQGGLSQLRLWSWNAWDQVVGQSARIGVRARVDVGWCGARDVARYIAFDQTRYSKAYQFKVPESWHVVGRWWAISGLPAEWSFANITARELVVVQRLLRRYRRSQSRYRPKFGRGKGLKRLWAIGQDSMTLIDALDRALPMLC